MKSQKKFISPDIVHNPLKESELSENQKVFLLDIYTHPTFIRDFQQQFKEIELTSPGRSNGLGFTAMVYKYESIKNKK